MPFMKKVTIRPAQKPDLEALCDLFFEFHEFHAQQLPAYLQSLGEPTKEDRQDLQKKLMQILEGSDSAILVAEKSGRILGFAEIYLKQPDPNDRAKTHTPYAHLQSLSVSQAFRRKGIGMRLLLGAETWASERGALELRLEIWDFSAGPLEFYQKAGYYTFRRTLAKNL